MGLSRAPGTPPPYPAALGGWDSEIWRIPLEERSRTWWVWSWDGSIFQICRSSVARGPWPVGLGPENVCGVFGAAPCQAPTPCSSRCLQL